ncbi:hypothetical protein LXL04_039554 [Taraxacum kok-saghyz]
MLRSINTRQILSVVMGYPRDAPATVLFGEWFRFGKPSDQQFLFERTSNIAKTIPPYLQTKKISHRFSLHLTRIRKWLSELITNGPKFDMSQR